MRDLVRSDDLNLPELSGHDLGLSDWGPYTKRYIGISADGQRAVGGACCAG